MHGNGQFLYSRATFLTNIFVILKGEQACCEDIGIQLIPSKALVSHCKLS
jgi:hypothetical protein